MSQEPRLLFNSPLEIGLRALTLLVEFHPRNLDIHDLVFLDYLTTHSSDVGGPLSLHPLSPHRSSELSIMRNLLHDGILLFISRGLIDRFFNNQGVIYAATEESSVFLTSLTSPYTLNLRNRAKWVFNSFESYSQNELRLFFNENIEKWGGEFTLSYKFED